MKKALISTLTLTLSSFFLCSSVGANADENKLPSEGENCTVEFNSNISDNALKNLGIPRQFQGTSYSSTTDLRLRNGNNYEGVFCGITYQQNSEVFNAGNNKIVKESVTVSVNGKKYPNRNFRSVINFATGKIIVGGGVN